jgi:hypothetical protein
MKRTYVLILTIALVTLDYTVFCSPHRRYGNRSESREAKFTNLYEKFRFYESKPNDPRALELLQKIKHVLKPTSPLEEKQENLAANIANLLVKMHVANLKEDTKQALACEKQLLHICDSELSTLRKEHAQVSKKQKREDAVDYFAAVLKVKLDEIESNYLNIGKEYNLSNKQTREFPRTFNDFAGDFYIDMA